MTDLLDIVREKSRRELEHPPDRITYYHAEQIQNVELVRISFPFRLLDRRRPA